MEKELVFSHQTSNIEIIIRNVYPLNIEEMLRVEDLYKAIEKMNLAKKEEENIVAQSHPLGGGKDKV